MLNRPPMSGAYSMDDLIDIFKKNLSSSHRQDKTQNTEFEVRFGNRNLKITRAIYDSVIRKICGSGFIPDTTQYAMKIQNDFDTLTGKKTQSNVRIELNSLEDIQYLCKTNDLPDLNKVVFMNKYSINEDISFPHYNNEFGFRTSIQKEQILNYQTSDIVKNIIARTNWESNKKTFRYLQRTSFINERFPHFRIDFSVVKQNSKNRQIRFTDTNLFAMTPNYEIEIELIDAYKITDFDVIKKQMKQIIRLVLSGIQNTDYPVSLFEIENVMEQYFDLIKTPSKDRYKKSVHFIGPSSVTLQKKNIIKDDTLRSVCIQDEFCVTDKADGERKLLFITSNGKSYFINTNMDIEFTGIIITDKKIWNTLIDGEYITKDKYNHNIHMYAAFDVYFIRGKDYRQMPFYVTNKTDIEEMKSKNKKNRYNLLASIIKLLNQRETIKSLSNKNRLNFDLKTFIPVKEEDGITIFDCCRVLLNKIKSNTYHYNTDGLIFTSKVLGVGQEAKDDSIKNKKYSWGHSFKWKPPEYNTIDFLVQSRKSDIGEEEVHIKQYNGKTIQYIELHLNVGFDITKHKDKQKVILNLEHEDKSFFKRGQNYKPAIFQPTNPSDETAYICHIPLTYDSTGKLVMMTEEGNIIQDDSIVEFKYDKTSKDKFMKWIPIRNRDDKTNEYRGGGSNYGNAYHVANNNWQSIHNPVTEQMLIERGNLTLADIESTEDDVYYNKSKSRSFTQALRNFHNLFVKKSLIQVCSEKNSDAKLIDMAVGKAGDLPKWISCKIKGVLGIDLSKDNILNFVDGACARYIQATEEKSDIPICMFIQGNTGKLIHNGEFLKPEMKTSEGQIIVDEPNNNAYDLNSRVDEHKNTTLGENIMNALLGKGQKEKQTIPFLKKYFGIFAEHFDICSIQFALHYMFESKRKLHSFLCNVSNFTKVGGYFTGTCYDGKRIFNILKGVENEELIEKYVLKNKIWHIRKRYSEVNGEEDSFLNGTETSIGYKVSVFQETINKEFDEYLVNFDYFIKTMKDYGFEIEQNVVIGEKKLPGVGSFELLFDVLSKSSKVENFGKARDMTPEEKYISFLNNYFIFKKVQNVNTEMLYEFHVVNDENADIVIDLGISMAKRLDKKVILTQE